MIRKVRTEFTTEIKDFEEFKKLMKEKLLNTIVYAIL